MRSNILKWGHRKFIIPIKKIIRAGISAERLSVSLALGITLGLIPLYGFTTILVGIVALSLRLNFVSMQIAHYIVQPIQIALFVPFFKMGDALFNNSDFSFTIRQYIQFFRADFWIAMREFWLINLSAIFVWSLISIPLFIILYFILMLVIGKYRPLIRHKVI
jgi:uncharacterized protein (DUF2062 family)